MQISRPVLLGTVLFPLFMDCSLFAQSKTPTHAIARPVQAIALHETSRKSIASEMGGAFMFPAKCDADGNLYIRKFATDRPLLGPIVKVDPEGKRVALFDPVAVSQLKFDRADAFSPIADGGLYQIAAVGISHPQIYVLPFSSDGSPAMPTRLDADFQPFQFAAFANGNLLVSGFQHDPQNMSDPGRPYTAVFSADGRLLAQLSLEPPPEPAHTTAKSAVKPAISDSRASTPTLDLSDAEASPDGNIYVLRRSSLSTPRPAALSQPIPTPARWAHHSPAILPMKESSPSCIWEKGTRLRSSARRLTESTDCAGFQNTNFKLIPWTPPNNCNAS